MDFDPAAPFDPPGPLVVSLVPTDVASLDAAIAALARTREADVIEVRLDRLAHDPDALGVALGRAVEASTAPLICALHGTEGFGDFDGDAEARAAVLRRAAGAGVAAVDVDLGFARRVGDLGLPRILSTHAPAPEADALDRAHAELSEEATSRDLVKLVPACANVREAAALLGWLRDRAPARTIAFGSGENAMFTRLLAPHLGSALVYTRPSGAVLDAVRAVGGDLLPAAPGQPSAAFVRRVWAAGTPDDETAFAAVVGRPIDHSASPVVHGAAAAALGIRAALVPVAPNALTDAVETPGLLAWSVTAPFKLDALEVGAPSQTARIVGAANTLILSPRTQFSAQNTDVAGIALAFANSGAKLEAGRTALVVGAGGAARAGVWALGGYGVQVTIAARRAEAAEALAAELRAELPEAPPSALALDDPRLTDGTLTYDFVLHTTPLGTRGRGIAPVPEAVLAGASHVLDAVYDPPRTELLRRAARAGARPISGRDWFLHQAWMQHLALFAPLLHARFGADGPGHGEVGSALAAMADAFRWWTEGETPRGSAPCLVLVGLRGAGKSTVGRLAAEAAGVPFLDLDAEIARRAGAADAGAMIERDGLAAFRAAEAEALADVLAGTAADAPRVLAAGGGVVEDAANRELLARAYTVWLDVDLDLARGRVAQDAAAGAAARPRLVEGADEFDVLSARREPWFAECAARRIHVDRLDEGRADLLAREVLLGWDAARPGPPNP